MIKNKKPLSRPTVQIYVVGQNSSLCKTNNDNWNVVTAMSKLQLISESGLEDRFVVWFPLQSARILDEACDHLGPLFHGSGDVVRLIGAYTAWFMIDSDQLFSAVSDFITKSLFPAIEDDNQPTTLVQLVARRRRRSAQHLYKIQWPEFYEDWNQGVLVCRIDFN